MRMMLILANSSEEKGRKGNGEYAGKNSFLQAEKTASTSSKRSYPAQFKSNSYEPRSPSLSTQSCKGQSSFEYYLLAVLAGILVIAVVAWAARLSASEDAVRSNALAAVKNLTGGFLPPKPEPNYSDSPVVSLEISTYEPYLSGEPAFFQVNAFASAHATLPRLSLAVQAQSGEHVRVEPSSIDSINLTFSGSYPAQFYPEAPGIYTITASCGDISAKRDVIVR